MGFFDRNRNQLIEKGIDPARLPPGQYLTDRFPVLHVGDVPDYEPGEWSLAVTGLVDQPFTLTLDELRELPSVDLTFDIHCVTKWSKFDILGLKLCGGGGGDERASCCHVITISYLDDFELPIAEQHRFAEKLEGLGVTKEARTDDESHALWGFERESSAATRHDVDGDVRVLPILELFERDPNLDRFGNFGDEKLAQQHVSAAHSEFAGGVAHRCRAIAAAARLMEEQIAVDRAQLADQGGGSGRV